MELKYDKKDIYSRLNEKQIKEADDYSKDYMKFLDNGKTEYLCVEETLKILDENGFEHIDTKEKLEKGDRVYFVNKEKCLFATVIGEDELRTYRKAKYSFT